MCNGRCLVQSQGQMVIQMSANGDPKKVGEHHSRVLLHGEYRPNRRRIYIGVKTSGSKISPIEFHQKQWSKSYTLSDRQHNSAEIFDKDGRYEVFGNDQIRQRDVGLFLYRGITITTEYLPSKLNIIADQKSREKVDSSEWKLDPKVFQGLFQLMGNPVVDLFAFGLNLQLPQYITWRPALFSQDTDAIHQDWSQDYLHAFPPFCLISRILQTVRQERRPSMLLITPTWYTQHWHLSLLQMLIQIPVILLRINSLLKDPLGK